MKITNHPMQYSFDAPVSPERKAKAFFAIIIGVVLFISNLLVITANQMLVDSMPGITDTFGGITLAVVTLSVMLMLNIVGHALVVKGVDVLKGY